MGGRDRPPKSLYRYQAATRSHLSITSYGDVAEQLVISTVLEAAETMSDPADLINRAVEALQSAAIDLPAFSTLDRLVNRLRAEVHEQTYHRVAGRVASNHAAVLDALLIKPPDSTTSAMARWQPTTGTPQGAVLSPLLANLYLHPLDEMVERDGYRMVRYADDFVILCQSEAATAAALRQVQAWVDAAGLTFHPDKTRTGDCRQPGQGFEFLGYRFEGGRRLVRAKSLKAFKDKVRSRTMRSRGNSLDRIVADLNPMLRGWFGYFKHARPGLYQMLDGFIRRRLRAILCKQEGCPSFGRSANDHGRWTNKFFAKHELFTLTTAYDEARHSR